MFPIKRTPEEGHTKRCLAKTMGTILQNWSELEYLSDYDFRLAVQNNDVLHTADEFLQEGISECLCDPIPKPDTVVEDTVWL